MATSSPPSKAIHLRTDPPSVLSADGPLSPSLTGALDLLEQLRQQGIALAPAMPEPDALISAAKKAGISPKEALTIYLNVLNYE